MPTRRVLHTADWHLGQSFHAYDRAAEHRAFLDWLLATIVDREVDALLVAGDVFDTANPSIVAQRQWFDFLAAVLRARPGCEVVAIAGNHDSASRLDAPEALTRALGLHVVGSARDASGAFDPTRLVVPLGARSPAGVWGHVAAVPFLRGEDLGTLTELAADDAFLRLSRARVDAVMGELARRAAPGHARFAMAHGVVVGEAQASDSERDVRIGNVEGVPVDLFPGDLTYVALGHLHRPQRAGGRDHVQYAGSPLPLHVSEADYAHRVVLLTVEDGRLAGRESLPVPRRVPIVRVPPGGRAGSCEGVIAMLGALPSHAHLAESDRPFLDVRFVMDAPRPGFVDDVRRAIEGKGYRLTAVRGEAPPRPEGDAAAPTRELRALEDYTPEEVFLRRYARLYPGKTPSEALLRAFRELVAEVSGATTEVAS